MTYQYEALAHIDKGWWVVDAVDIDKSTKVGTLAETQDAAERLYRQHLPPEIEKFKVSLLVARSTRGHGGISGWTHVGRRLRRQTVIRPTDSSTA